MKYFCYGSTYYEITRRTPICPGSRKRVQQDLSVLEDRVRKERFRQSGFPGVRGTGRRHPSLQGETPAAERPENGRRNEGQRAGIRPSASIRLPHTDISEKRQFLDRYPDDPGLDLKTTKRPG